MEEKVVAGGRGRKKQASLECLAMPLKRKRGRKPRSSSPPSPNPGPLSFFKVLIGDFHDVLFIPPMAACTLKGLAKNYVFIKDIDGKIWTVKISIVDGSLAFHNGWHDFVSDHSITVGEFVLFTYTGGLLFTARIFGTSSLERLNFQMKERKGKCPKERCASELQLVNATIPGRQKKVSQSSEEKHSPSGTEILKCLKRKKISDEFDFSKVLMVESDSISEGVLELSGAGEKPLYDSNIKELDIAVHDSEETFPRNSDAIDGELNTISLTEVVNSEIENIDVVTSKIIRNTVNTTEKGVPLLQSKQTAEEPDAMTKTTTWVLKAHSDIKNESVEMCGSLMQLNKEHDEMRNNEKVEQEVSYDHETLNCELHGDKIASLSNLEHADCNLKMEFNKIKPEGIADYFVSADGICYHNLDEKLIEVATGPSFNTNEHVELICQNDLATFHLETRVRCETISAVSSNHTLDHTDEKNINLLSISEEYEVPHTKGSSTIAESGLQSCNKFHECFVKGNDRQTGSAHDAFFDADEKNVTPCSSLRCRFKTDTTDSTDIPSSSCVSFSVCLSDDVQSSLEFQSTLSCQIVKLKHERKVVVLQDPSMRCWPVLYHKTNNFVGFLGGWVDFAKANNICRGDICEFELINKLEYKFRVQIMKAEGSICDEKVA